MVLSFSYQPKNQTIKNLFYLLLLASLPIHAQDLPWLEVGSEWTYQHGHAFGSEHFQVTFGITEETTFAGKNCAKMEPIPIESGLPCSSITPPYYYYVSNDSLFFAKSSDTEFQLAVDFGAGVGDSWNFTTGENEFATEYLVTVSGISTIEVEGYTLRKLELSYSFNEGSGVEPFIFIYPSSLEVIEVVGSLHQFFTPFGQNGVCDFEANTQLQCFDSPSLSYLNSIFPNCDFILSIDDAQYSSDISIFPNPTLNSIVLTGELLKNTDWVEIYNLQGAVVLRHSVSNAGDVIDLSALENGVYLIQCNDNGNILWAGKVINK